MAAAHARLTPSLNEDRAAAPSITVKLSVGLLSRHVLRNSALPSLEPASKTMMAEPNRELRNAAVNDVTARFSNERRLNELMIVTNSTGNSRESSLIGGRPIRTTSRSLAPIIPTRRFVDTNRKCQSQLSRVPVRREFRNDLAQQKMGRAYARHP